MNKELNLIIFFFFFYKLILIIIDYEQGFCSIYEFIYSFRESKESPFPELTSQTAIDALKFLKKIKEEISSG